MSKKLVEGYPLRPKALESEFLTPIFRCLLHQRTPGSEAQVPLLCPERLARHCKATLHVSSIDEQKFLAALHITGSNHVRGRGSPRLDPLHGPLFQFQFSMQFSHARARALALRRGRGAGPSHTEPHRCRARDPPSGVLMFKEEADAWKCEGASKRPVHGASL